MEERPPQQPEHVEAVRPDLGYAPDYVLPGPAARVPPSPTSMWHYRVRGELLGPVTFELLCHLAAKREVLPIHEVKPESATDFAEASTVPGLFSDAATGMPLEPNEIARRLEYQAATATGLPETWPHRIFRYAGKATRIAFLVLFTITLVVGVYSWVMNWYRNDYRLRVPEEVKRIEEANQFQPGYWRMVLRCDHRGLSNYVLRYWPSGDGKAVERCHLIEYSDKGHKEIDLPLAAVGDGSGPDKAIRWTYVKDDESRGLPSCLAVLFDPHHSGVVSSSRVVVYCLPKLATETTARVVFGEVGTIDTWDSLEWYWGEETHARFVEK